MHANADNFGVLNKKCPSYIDAYIHNFFLKRMHFLIMRFKVHTNANRKFIYTHGKIKRYLYRARV